MSIKGVLKNRTINTILRRILKNGIIIYESFKSKNKSLEWIKKNTKSILIIEWAGLGELLQVTPTLKGLKETFPQAKVTVATLEANKGTIINNPNVDEIITTKASDIKGLLNKLKNKKFDLFVMFNSRFENYLLGSLLKIKYKLGYLAGYRKVRASGFKIKKIINNDIHRVFYSLNILKVFNYKSKDPRLKFYLDKKSKQFANKLFKNIKKSIAINPSTYWKAKTWPADNFIELIKQLFKKYKVKIILVGGPKEAKIANYIEKKINSKNLINIAGTTSLPEFGAVLAKSDLLITVDTGPMQMVGDKTKVVSLWFCTNPLHYYVPTKKPEKDTMIYKKLPCSPCAFLDLNQQSIIYEPKCKSMKCLHSITVDDVLKEVKKKLK